MLDSIIMLFRHYCTDQPDDGIPIREDFHNTGGPVYFPVERLSQVVEPESCPNSLGACEDSIQRLLQIGRYFGKTLGVELYDLFSLIPSSPHVGLARNMESNVPDGVVHRRFGTSLIAYSRHNACGSDAS
nr:MULTISPECIES: hypothetical protein [Corynebacterium]